MNPADLIKLKIACGDIADGLVDGIQTANNEKRDLLRRLNDNRTAHQQFFPDELQGQREHEIDAVHHEGHFPGVIRADLECIKNPGGRQQIEKCQLERLDDLHVIRPLQYPAVRIQDQVEKHTQYQNQKQIAYPIGVLVKIQVVKFQVI